MGSVDKCHNISFAKKNRLEKVINYDAFQGEFDAFRSSDVNCPCRS